MKTFTDILARRERCLDDMAVVEDPYFNEFYSVVQGGTHVVTLPRGLDDAALVVTSIVAVDAPDSRVELDVGGTPVDVLPFHGVLPLAAVRYHQVALKSTVGPFKVRVTCRRLCAEVIADAAIQRYVCWTRADGVPICALGNGLLGLGPAPSPAPAPAPLPPAAAGGTGGTSGTSDTSDTSDTSGVGVVV